MIERRRLLVGCDLSLDLTIFSLPLQHLFEACSHVRYPTKLALAL
jgi:hypothetical protein